ncbi:MAG TPA: fused response regulator/phosphatase [Pseudomonadales bacterium]|nr:fused response regulator/phosphatase [Pseudomonadales bacterium]
MSVGRNAVLVAGGPASLEKKIKHALKDSGYEIDSVSTPDACLARIADTPPVLLFISLFDKKLDAAALLAGVRDMSSELPVVVVADEPTAGNIVGLLDQGADGYLVYPFSHPSLVSSAVTRNIERRRQTRKRKRSERDMKRLNKALAESVKVLEQDQHAGLRVQRGMMPESPFTLGRLTLTHRIVASAILSGDFIDYFELPDGLLLFYIADVAGHGTSGAFITVLLKSLSTRLYNEFEELGLRGAGDILGWFNRELIACGLPQHVTMFLAVLDKTGAQLEYANAAHFPGAILSSADSARYLEIGGLPLGIYETARYSSHQVSLPDDFRMVMFSDGVFEILNEETLQEKEQKLLSLVECAGGEIDVLAEKLGLGEVKEVPDDIAVFTVAKAG